GQSTHARVAGSLRYDNLWQREHSIGMQFQLSPEDTKEVRTLSATYSLPFGRDRLLALYAVRSLSNVPAGVGDTIAVGNATIYGARAIVSLPTVGDYYHSATFGADYKDIGQAQRVFGADAQSTPIQYVPMIVQYNGSQLGTRSISQFDAALNFAL